MSYGANGLRKRRAIAPWMRASRDWNACRADSTESRAPRFPRAESAAKSFTCSELLVLRESGERWSVGEGRSRRFAGATHASHPLGPVT